MTPHALAIEDHIDTLLQQAQKALHAGDRAREFELVNEIMELNMELVRIGK